MTSPAASPGRGGRLLSLVLGVVLISGLTGSANAALIAEWNFDDGSINDSAGAFDLTAVGGGPAIAGGTAIFDGDESSPSFLESAGYGGSSTWSVSMRIRSEAPFDQGGFQGIFSNNSSSTANNSWQFESSGGNYQFRSLNAGTFSVGAPTGGWDTIVIRKNGGDGDVWLNGVQVVASFGTNPGGLQNFRLGTNRNSNNFYHFEADWFRVYDTHEDPMAIPEPTTALLLGLGFAVLTHRRVA